MKQPLITNIQKYSIHDGTGIRTTVFFKGCPLSCKWCHNPETQKFKSEILYYQERCVDCGVCREVCPVEMDVKCEAESRKSGVHREECTACGACVDECLHNARELCGTPWTIENLVKEVLKDQAFYETSGGGVTLSGGEVLAQNPDYLERLMKTLHSRGISIFVDTCGMTAASDKFSGNKSILERILPYVDTFLYDIKLLDEQKHIQYTGRSNAQILKNLKWLSNQNASLWIRIPVIGGVNDEEEEIKAIGRFLKENGIKFKQLHLLPYHNTGSGKYEHLSKEYEGRGFYVPDQTKMETLKAVLEQEEIGPVYIGG